jgi:histidinol-phosphate/aromatic aminotransferase/cobyric acid decarboxylase-like protein
MSALRHVKPAVRELAAYTLAARDARVKINQNENPHELPGGLKRRVLEQALARPWGRYPPFDPADARWRASRDGAPTACSSATARTSSSRPC